MQDSPFYLSDHDLLERIRRSPHAKSNFKNLARETGAKGDQRKALEAALERLAEKGELIEYKSSHFVAAAHSNEYITGRLQMHRDGYGFVIPLHKQPGITGDIYINSSNAAQAMHGDRVLARVTWTGPDGKAEGEILKVLSRAHQTVVGEFRTRRRGNWVKPHDNRIQQWIFIPEGMEIPPPSDSIDRIGAAPVTVGSTDDLDGMIVNIEILEFPTDGDDGVGRVIEILGRPGDFGLDVEVTIRKHHLPHKFPAAVLAEARGMSTEIPAETLKNRTDWRHLPIVTIDGETARDFDDAIFVDHLPNGNWRLDVHIADVSHYVQPSTAIDQEALFRGTSVYFPDRAVPMLPHELSTNICSLRPDEDRLVMSAELEIDHTGDVVTQKFSRGVIRSAARMTYTAVQKVLDGDASERAKYAAHTAHFERMEKLAKLLNRKRHKRGSIDLDIPEPLIEFDDNHQMTGVRRAPRLFAHRIIEEFMLAANEAVASHISSAQVATLYRIHETPDIKKVMDFETIAAQFGYTFLPNVVPSKKFSQVDRKRDGRKVRRDLVMADERTTVDSRSYQKLIAKFAGKPESRILSYMMLRSLKQARYSNENEGHFALASSFYTHFTSPIRRYPDLIIHRILGRLIDKLPPAFNDHQLEEYGNDCSFTERRAAEAERDLVEWKKVQFMVDRIGDEFEALIVSITRFGMFVELEDLFIEGLVPLDSLPNERFFFQEQSRRLIGERSRREFKIGERTRVILNRVDEQAKTITFALWEPPKQKRSNKKKKTGKRR